jgi:hypothetical protein
MSCCDYDYVGVEAWIPAYDTDDWYRPMGGVAPLMRFWKGEPENDHFYTTSGDEAELVQLYGWHAEGTEGALYEYSSGTELFPLYQFAISTKRRAGVSTVWRAMRCNRNRTTEPLPAGPSIDPKAASSLRPCI